MANSCKTKGCLKHTVALGFCDTCYRRFKKHGTADAVPIPSLPDEKWAAIKSCPGWQISTHGRVKSCRRKIEKLVKIQRGKADGINECLYFRDRAAKGRTFRVHIEMLKAFRQNPHGDTRGVFLDGDRFNCRLDNLQWFGKDYLLPLAIEKAKKSSSRWRTAFLDFWGGNNGALDEFFQEMRHRMKSFLTSRTVRMGRCFYDVDNIVQEALLHVFLAIERGQVQNLDSVASFCMSIARSALSRSVRNKVFEVALTQKNPADGEEFSIADIIGFCHPSAEVVAIAKQQQLARELIAF